MAEIIIEITAISDKDTTALILVGRLQKSSIISLPPIYKIIKRKHKIPIDIGLG
ncbi:hypothetical protein [Hafnia alvei]|uniref:hypothetical protein n=1 Tax=Hafnia alvei TaxID=569 RepID=UPI0012F66824|nr:hypothetical protein [Hafnia alvei]QQE45319.1 hypothetical protein I6H95_08530 [Hafnia alvei]